MPTPRPCSRRILGVESAADAEHQAAAQDNVAAAPEPTFGASHLLATLDFELPPEELAPEPAVAPEVEGPAADAQLDEPMIAAPTAVRCPAARGRSASPGRRTGR